NPSGLDWQRFVLAVDGRDEMIGCGQVKPHRDGSWELASIAVVPEWRGRGVARAIIEHLMARADPPLWLMCNSKLIPLYERFGFREVKETAAMPPYFRRIIHLASPFFRLLPAGEYLAVMVWFSPVP
ncbi:MAG: GNAT family N-acetyltransferase, partial [Chloroflexota bacterium]